MELAQRINKMRKYNGRILLIDDETYCLIGLKTMLESYLDFDHQVDMAMSGEEALKAITAAHELGLSYKLILTDLSMPGMSGIETAKAAFGLYEQYGLERPTIVALSGHVGTNYFK